MATDKSLGERLKKRRLESGMSLRKLAELTGVTASFLSQVEHGKVNVSLNSLQNISEALNVHLSYFLSDPTTLAEDAEIGEGLPRATGERAAAYSPVVRVNERAQLFLPMTGAAYEMLVPSFGNKMVAISGRLAPGTGNAARKLREPTEEFLYLLSGNLLVGLNSGEYVLCPGESIYFKGDDLVQLSCHSEEEDAVWISVISPPVF
ncbi:helix-turn-helix domain-containing protein [Ornatilinea apprima]|uniref:helix-turn-helix domain-containing protein n=1 Tax=Ornatilinea apprima TaxID=1134406 RepID=UPI0009463AF4|nr:helix-turn-helix transcriptional regulator [Ornatilinea apprima]